MATTVNGPIRWRGLLVFWAAALLGLAAGASVLQVLGPLPKNSHRLTGPPEPNEAVPTAVGVAARNLRVARLGVAEQKLAPSGPMIESIKAQKTGEGMNLSRAKDRAETLTPGSAGSQIGLQSPIAQTMDLRLRLEARAQTAADLGDFDEAEHLLALVGQSSPGKSNVDAASPRSPPLYGRAAAEYASPPNPNTAAPLVEIFASTVRAGSPSTPASQISTSAARTMLLAKGTPTDVGIARVEVRGLSGETLLVRFQANAASAEAAAKHLAERLRAHFKEVEVHGEVHVPPVATVSYFRNSDHQAAREIGILLSEMRVRWRIERLWTIPSAPRRRALELWIPAIRS
jgi:hypothetical protein